MDVAHGRIIEHALRCRRDLRCSRDRASAVYDAVVGAVAAHDVALAIKERWHVVTTSASNASLGVQENRPQFSIGLWSRERTMGKCQERITFINHP